MVFSQHAKDIGYIGRLRSWFYRNQINWISRSHKTRKGSKIYVVHIFLFLFLLLRLYQKTIHQFHAKRSQHRIHHILSSRFSDNHQISSSSDILVKICLFDFRHSAPHFSDYQNTHIFRNRLVQVYIRIIKPLINQCGTHGRNVRKHTVTTFPWTIRLPFSVPFHKTHCR